MAHYLHGKGYQARPLDGGFRAWMSAGYPLEEGDGDG